MADGKTFKEISANVSAWFRQTVYDIKKERFVKRQNQNRWYEHNIMPVDDFYAYVREGTEKLQGGREVRIYKTPYSAALAEEIKIEAVEGFVLRMWNTIEILEEDEVITIRFKV
jgi:hypothetical protein